VESAELLIRGHVLIGLDLSAAFDTVDREILLHRLKFEFGITAAPLTWLHSNLESAGPSLSRSGSIISHQSSSPTWAFLRSLSLVKFNAMMWHFQQYFAAGAAEGFEK